MFDPVLMKSTFRIVGGRRFWILPLLPLAWLVFQGLLGLLDDEQFNPAHAQGLLMGIPLAVLAVFFGIRVIAGEIGDRTLEIAYTVPGGVERVWWAKLFCAVVLLAAAEALLAVAIYFFFTSFPVTALYGAMQSAVFYLALSTALAALFRSETAGAIATAAVLAFNAVVLGDQVRGSPFWNPYAFEDADPTELLVHTIQNRIGFVLVIAAILALAFMRANRRERMLGNG